MQTIKEFIEKHKLTMESRPHEKPTCEEGKTTFFQFVVKIKSGSVFVEFDYSMGEGLGNRVKFFDSMAWHHKYKGLPLHSSRSGAYVVIPPTPELEMVLESLRNDASAGLMTFEDFCGNFGYDTDSRKAESVWSACRDASAKMTRFFGLSGLNELLSETDSI